MCVLVLFFPNKIKINGITCIDRKLEGSSPFFVVNQVSNCSDYFLESFGTQMRDKLFIKFARLLDVQA